MVAVTITNHSALGQSIASAQASKLAPAQAKEIIGKYIEEQRNNHRAWANDFSQAELNRRTSEREWRKFYKKVYDESTSWWKTTLLFVLNAIQIWALYKQYDQQKEIADRTYELADRQLRLAEDMYRFYKDKFQPHEVDVGKQIDNYFRNPYREQYELTGGRFALNARIAMKGERKKALTCFSEYCTGGLTATLRDIAVKEANLVANAMNSGVKYENLRKIRFDDKWMRVRLTYIQAGRGVARSGITGIDGAASAFHSFGADPGAALSRLLTTIAHTTGSIIDSPVLETQPVAVPQAVYPKNISN